MGIKPIPTCEQVIALIPREVPPGTPGRLRLSLSRRRVRTTLCQLLKGEELKILFQAVIDAYEGQEESGFDVVLNLASESRLLYLNANLVLAFCGHDVFVVKNRGLFPAASATTPTKPDSILAFETVDAAPIQLQLRTCS